LGGFPLDTKEDFVEPEAPRRGHLGRLLGDYVASGQSSFHDDLFPKLRISYITSGVSSKITSSSTAEYFSKNLQQVGFSSGTKAVLTTLKEAVDNSLDACEDAEILPEIHIEIEKISTGSQKNMDQIRVKVVDNGPGLSAEDVPHVYGEYLASSKFGRGRCSRGQQGIGISAATTWAQITNAHGARVITKTAKMKQAFKCEIEVDIKKNVGVIKEKSNINWDREHGVSCEFIFDGRLQLNGDAGILTYLQGTSLVNPHLKLIYKINDDEPVTLERVSDELIQIPEPVAPHPHTMKLGEFLAHGTLFGKATLATFLKTGFSRVNEATFADLSKLGLKKAWLKEPVSSLSQTEMKAVFAAIQEAKLMAPSTRSVLSIGEDALSKSIRRLGEVDFFSVLSRKPTICDAKPVAVEVAIARLKNSKNEFDDPVEVLRFANRVPLQFDKGACAILKSIESINWKSYGLNQPKRSIPTGPYVIAVSVVSPFIKFKNASKETIDASDELVAELRLALMQAGQRLARFVNKEKREFDLEKKRSHIEQFGPILIEGIGRITGAPRTRLDKASDGLLKILGRDEAAAEDALAHATTKQKEMVKKLDQYDEEEFDRSEEDSEEGA
jgi:DNA topoisomerase-6 subunit B